MSVRKLLSVMDMRQMPYIVAVAAFLNYFYQWRQLLPVIIAAAVHEMGHFAAIAALDMSVKRIRLTPTGLCMEYLGATDNREEAAAALAGPAAGIILFLLSAYFRVFLITGRISLLFSAFNLIPAVPLDGGHIAAYLLGLFLDEAHCSAFLTASGICAGILLLLSGVSLLPAGSGIGLITAAICLLYADLSTLHL